MIKWFLDALTYATLDLNSLFTITSEQLICSSEREQTQPFPQRHKRKYWGWRTVTGAASLQRQRSSWVFMFPLLCRLLRDRLGPEYRNPAPLLTPVPTAMCTLDSRAAPWNHTEAPPAWHCIPLYLFSFCVFLFLTGSWLFCLNTFHTHKFLPQGQSVSGTMLKRYLG